MVIVMQEGATDEQIQHVIDRIVASGFDVLHRRYLDLLGQLVKSRQRNLCKHLRPVSVSL